MAGETVITVIGNLTADPELRFTSGGVAVADFTVASTPRNFDRDSKEWKDGDTLFLRCSLWREAAENAAESLRKGMRVIVQGRLVQRNFEDRDGNRRTVVEMQADEVGPSLRRAVAKVTRKAKGSSDEEAPAKSKAPRFEDDEDKAPSRSKSTARPRYDDEEEAPRPSQRGGRRVVEDDDDDF